MMTDHAILIGIGDYPGLADGDQSVRLQGPLNDVEAVKAWLLDARGGAFADESNIHVIVSAEAAPAQSTARPTADELEAVLLKIAELSDANNSAGKGTLVGERLYLFMTGHGFSPRRSSGCLFTANATPRFNAHIHATGWLNWLQDAGYFREFVLWMDCCMNRILFVPLRDPPLQAVSSGIPPRASFIAFAAQRPLKAVETRMSDDGKVHGVFTWALLQGLRGAAADHNGRVTGRSLADWVRNAQCALMTDAQRANSDMALEPEILQEDVGLVFVRGIAPLRYCVELDFPPAAHGVSAWLWSGIPPIAQPFTIDGGEQWLAPGLYLVQVPALGLRHGFEVLGDLRVEVRETGPAIVTAAAGKVFVLDVDPGDLSAEIFVIDQRLALVESQPGCLSTPLPFGLFKIKTRIGRGISQRVIMLDTDKMAISSASIARPPSAVVPLAGTTSSVATHTLAREWALDASSMVAGPGTGSGALMLMVREVGGLRATPLHDKPWQNVCIVDASGAMVLDCMRDAQLHGGANPYAIGGKELAPGPYFLRQTLNDGTVIEQSLIVCAGWRLEVYLLRRVTPGTSTLDIRPRVSLMMRRIGQGASNVDTQDRLAESARLALADERRILNAGLENLLMEKFDNPIAGLIGAHLLLLERERDRYRDIGKLDMVVGRLLPLLGPSHPDLAALALQCGATDLPRNQALDGPPMLARSWPLLVCAAQDGRIDLPAAMWQRTQAFASLPPFMVWAINEEIKHTVQQTLRQALAGGTASAMAMATRPSDSSSDSPESLLMRARQLRLPPSALEALVDEPLS